jgi:enoyl-CoA hydratase
MADLILTELTDGVYTVTLNRPEKLNCINIEMLETLEASILIAENNKDICIVVIKGAGERAFSTGGDLKVFNNLPQRETMDWIRKGHSIFNRLENLSKPTIAVIKGYAFGGGLELALACDFRLAAERASFRLPEVLHGWPPGWGALTRLARLIGQARAKEMILLGEALRAETAYQYGLVTRVVEELKLPKALQGIIETLDAIDADAFAIAKSALQDQNTVQSSGIALDSLAAVYTKFVKPGTLNKLDSPSN